MSIRGERLGRQGVRDDLERRSSSPALRKLPVKRYEEATPDAHLRGTGPEKLEITTAGWMT
jgi:hypothetical protein